MPPEKKAKKEKVISKAKKSSESSSTDSKIADLDSKWSERFNRLEALLLSKTFQPTFSSEVKLTPFHSPPTNIPRDSEPFFQPTGHTGTAFSADMHQAASQLDSDCQSTTTERTQARVSLLPSINQPASSHPTNGKCLQCQQSALAKVPLLHSINQPASLSPTDFEITSEAHWHRFVQQGFLCFPASTHQPASHRTGLTFLPSSH